MERRQSGKYKNNSDEKEEVISTIKNFERLPFTSIKMPHGGQSQSEVEENYDISYDIERSYDKQSNHSRLDSKNTMFQEQIEFKAKRRKYQTDVRAKETSLSESSSMPLISPEKEREPDNERDIN